MVLREGKGEGEEGHKDQENRELRLVSLSGYERLAEGEALATSGLT